MSTRVLYVCTYWGVRSEIARLLTEALDEPGLVAESAGFETGTIDALPRQLMMERGLDLPAASPETLFTFVGKKDEYDYVITLCDQHTQENYPVLFNAVELLFSAPTQIIHWNIPDFMSINASGDARKTAAEAIVTNIESEVCSFVNQVRERQAANG